MFMNVTSFDKLCRLAGPDESLAAYLERVIEREYHRRVKAMEQTGAPNAQR
jgi:hypothetical protein